MIKRNLKIKIYLLKPPKAQDLCLKQAGIKTQRGHSRKGLCALADILRLCGLVFLTVLLCSVYSSVLAQPNITGIDKTNISYKDTVTITGSSFGIKEQAAPLLWDDFEWGKEGDPCTDGGWTNMNPSNGAEISSTQSNSGTRSAYAKFLNPDPGGTQWQAVYKRYTPSLKVYATFMLYWDAEDRYSSRGPFKCGRIVSQTVEGDSYGGGPYITMQAGPQDGDWYYAIIYSDEDVKIGEFNTHPFGPGEWHRIEFWFILSDPAGADNGYVNCWVDLRSRTEGYKPWPITGVTRAAGNPNEMDTFTSVHMWPRCPTPYAEAWMDDVYVDNTLARVEIGDAPTLDTCTHREIQIPVAWSDNSITFTANQGSFADGEQAYLYVVDENGNVNEQGYPVRFGGGLLGDVNSDGKVDIKDLILVAKDFGKTSGFNPNCDLNGDGRVDIKDLIIVAKNFGRSG